MNVPSTQSDTRPDDPGRAADPLELSDEQLLADCDVHRYRASGPGGQKRNKTDSAVRLRHRPTGLTVVGTESRSQHENRARALHRLREALALATESPVDPQAPAPAWLASCVDRRGQLQVGRHHERYFHFLRRAAGLLIALEGRIGPAARALGTTSSQLIELLRTSKRAWARAEELRKRFGHPPLR
jgi:hypothetical protein